MNRRTTAIEFEEVKATPDRILVCEKDVQQGLIGAAAYSDKTREMLDILNAEAA